MIIADTNVVSEFMKDQPHPNAFAWARKVDAADLGICVVTVEEIERGLGRLPDGRRRRTLQERWRRLLAGFSELIAVYDVAAATATARILVDAETSGRSISLADAQIAGICVSAGLELATRNTSDFAGVRDLAVINPFD